MSLNLNFIKQIKRLFRKQLTHNDISLLGYAIFEEETFEEFMRRYDGDYKEFYTLVKTSLPLIFKHLHFYRLVNPEEGKPKFSPNDDSFALFDNGKKSFALLLDYYGVICIWNGTNINWETGYWADDAVQDVINIIKEMKL
jgi:transposase